MRLFLFLTASLLLALAPVRADDAAAATDDNPYDPLASAPAPLAAAIRGFAKDAGRWAYTQRLVESDRKGKPREVWTARFDPSQHYDVQWTLLERDGQKPTERQQKKFRAKRLEMEKKGRKTLGELLVLEQAVLLAAQADAGEFLTYEVPLKPSDDMRLPPEKFLVQVKITRESHRLHAIDVLLRSKLRVAGVVSVKSGEAHLRFVSVLADCGPAVASVSVSGVASVMFIPFGGHTEVTRSEFKRVKPYDERFSVNPGPLRTLDF